MRYHYTFGENFLDEKLLTPSIDEATKQLSISVTESVPGAGQIGKQLNYLSIWSSPGCLRGANH